MMNLPQGADLAAHRRVPGGAVEELERAVLTFDVVPHPVDPRKPAPSECLKNFEPVIEDVAGSVVGGLGPSRRVQICWVWFGQRLAVAGGQGSGRVPRGPGRTDAFQAFGDFSRAGRPLFASGRKQGRDEVFQSLGKIVLLHSWRRAGAARSQDLGAGSGEGRMTLAHGEDRRPERV
jgi:hypothetical protein